MRAAAIHILCIVVGTSAWRAATCRDASFGFARLHGNTVRAGIGPEIMIEGSVLLHDDDDVFDLGHIAGSGSIGIGCAKKGGCSNEANGTANKSHPRPPGSRSHRELDLQFGL